MVKDFDDSGEKSKQKREAADFYGKAHDFALLSEEEYGVALTEGYLDYENFDSKHFTSKMIDFAASVNMSSIDICSEFSAQCLLLKVAHIIDDFNDHSFSNDSRNDELTKDEEVYLSRAMSCLIEASMEMRVLDVDMNEKVTEQVPWLALSLMISLRDDEFCSYTLNQRGLLKKLESILNETKETLATEDPNGKNTNNVDRVFLLATRAEYFGMNESTKLLLSFYVKESNKGGYDIHDVVTSSVSIGLIQRKIINLASRVEEVVDVFNAVYEQVKGIATRVMDTDTQTKPYKTEDIDYFVVEAHNRAVSLLYIGDFTNAEKLLTVALNLIPYSGKEVACYAGDIRNVYRGVIQRCANEASVFPSIPSENLLDLFA